jgi:hypothetical protein
MTLRFPWVTYDLNVEDRGNPSFSRLLWAAFFILKAGTFNS